MRKAKILDRRWVQIQGQIQGFHRPRHPKKSIVRSRHYVQAGTIGGKCGLIDSCWRILDLFDAITSGRRILGKGIPGSGHRLCLSDLSSSRLTSPLNDCVYVRRKKKLHKRKGPRFPVMLPELLLLESTLARKISPTHCLVYPSGQEHMPLIALSDKHNSCVQSMFSRSSHVKVHI